MDDAPLSHLEFCVIDTETTGGAHALDRVIDVAVFRFKDGVVVEKFQSLINPGCSISAWIKGLTGIDDEMVARAPQFEEIEPRLSEILNKGIFTAHNAGFDYGFIRSEYNRLGKEFIRPQCCTLKIARKLLPELPSRSLGFLCEHMLIDIADRHRAHGDAEATVYVLKSLFRQLKNEYQITTWLGLEEFLRRRKKKKDVLDIRYNSVSH